MKEKFFLERIKALKKPLWLQWSWFPKDEQPPTLSVFEIILYFIAFSIACYFFVAFNRIPCHTFLISAEKLSNNRYIDTLFTEKDTSVCFCFNTAKIVLQIPRTTVFAKDSFDVCRYEINEDHLKLENLYLVSDTTSTLQTGGLSQYWRAVFDNVAGRFDETFRILKWNHELYETNSFRDELKDIIDVHVERHFPIERLDNALWPNKCKRYPDKRNIFRILKANMTNKDLIEYWDSIFDNSTPLNLKHYSIFWDKYINHLRTNNNPQRVFKQILERRAKDALFPIVQSGNSKNDKWSNKYYFSLVSSINKTLKKDKEEPILDSLKLNDFWTTKKYILKYDKTLQCAAYGLESFAANSNDHSIEKHRFSTINNPNLVNYVSIQSPGWFNLYDISQGWYKILFKTSTIDSTELKIDFVGATEFFPMKIEPDEKGSNYIKFTDPIKVLQIRKDGLTFYAKFKELENRQIIRSFAVTAILSGLIIVFLTFLILSIYRGLRSIRDVSNYDDMQKWLAYTRRHNANIFDVFFKDKENISDKDIVSTIKDVAEFFSLPVPAIQNRCEAIAQIMTSKEGTECELFYDWKLMEKAGINNVDTLRLSFVHELAHETLFQKRFLLFENELWVQELAADMIVGAFSTIGCDVATGKYKYVLAQLPANITHPDGKLRAAIVEFGRDYAGKLKQEQKLNDIKDVLTGLPAFVYSHYKELQEDWDMVRLEDVDKEEPIVETPIDYESLPDTNLLKQYYMKHKKEKEDEI